MALSAGTRLGPYEVLSLLGRGGMGEVYRGRDTRLDRTVAIKVLPSELASDPQFRERFDREARAISHLDHPHICALYDLGEHDHTSYLVMQYLEGQTLAERLATGALPLEQVFQYAIQIAGALDRAHSAGIVHRDLKPGNVMLTRSGATLLDFGLAKSGAPVVAGTSATVLPTTPPGLTLQGTILGTFQYMAPEQLEGREADTRTDIFAFGAVLYEMATGRKAFDGQTQASVIGAILKDTPPTIASLQPKVPPALDRVVARCLQKDPDRRWQTARDLEDELRWIAQGGHVTSAAPGPTASASRPERRAWLVVATLVLIVLALSIPAIRYFRDSASVTRSWMLDVVTPPTSDPLSFALSPDGRQLAYVATTEGAARLWVRPLEQTTAYPLPGTEGASFPFWDPDGRNLGFFADAKLKRVAATGGTPQTLYEVPNGRGGTWNRDGVIIFAPITPFPLMRIDADGGDATPLTKLVNGQLTHRWPQFLPDGRRFLFFAVSSRRDTQGAYLASLDGGEPIRILDNDSAAFYAPPASLLMVRQGALVAWSFDVERGSISGDAVPIATGIGADLALYRGAFAVSSPAVLALRSGVATPRRQLVWTDRGGKALGTVGPPDGNGLSSPELSLDDRKVAIFRITERQNNDVWLYEDVDGVASRFTFDDGIDSFPVWSPDARQVVFRSTRNNEVYDLFERAADRSAEEKPIQKSKQNKTPTDWSRDGKSLLFTTQVANTTSDVWALPMTGEPAIAVATKPFDEAAGQFSPDGKWVAYQSNESGGRNEVYVQPFPQGGYRQVSRAGGSQPRWARDGKELFYVAPDGQLMTVAISFGADGRTLEHSAPKALFTPRWATGGNIFSAGYAARAQYAVAKDGRFLINMSIDDAAIGPITVVLNWADKLKPSR